LHVVPRRVLAVALGHPHRLPIAAMRVVVASRVTQVDAAGERHVVFGGRRVTDDDQLLMMRPADANALIQ
jgi:hypothetical protein